MNSCNSTVKRLARLERLNRRPSGQVVAMAACSLDPVLWINDWVWTYDPREKVTTLPFVLFERQIEFIRWLQECENDDRDGIAEKCRDVGFTWLCCAYAAWGWLFRPGWRCGFGSRKLELVDKIGDPSCIFEKIRFILNGLPRWMQPREWSGGYCKILNSDNGASVSGEGGDDIGRGDRTSMYFVDEAAFLERSDRVDAALSQTSRCKIWVSTPNGQGNSFYRKRFGGNFPVFTFRWKDDPRKDAKWYEKQKATLDPVTLAQEVDIDYSASVEGICIPAKWVRAAVNFGGASSSGELIAALDIAAEGGDNNVLGFRRGATVQLPVLHWNGVSTSYTAIKAREQCVECGAAYLNYDAGGGYGEPVAQIGRDDELPFRVQGLNGGNTPSLSRWKDGRTSQEMFLNARAEWWWMLRERFRKTWEVVEEQRDYPKDELISIPDVPSLISELSLPLVETTETGKIKIESKSKMRARGVKSPDFADMLSMLFAALPIESPPPQQTLVRRTWLNR